MSKDTMDGILKLLERLPVPVLIGSPITGKVLWVNRLLVEMAAVSSGDAIVGTSILDWVNPRQQGIALADLAKVALGQSPPSAVYDLKRATGETAAGHVASIPMLFRGQPAMLSLVTDVSEQERLIRNLADSEERYRALLDNTPSGIVVVVGESVVFANTALLNALAMESPDELLGKSMYDFIAPEYRKPVREARRHVITTGKPLSAAPVELLTVHGDRVPTTAATSRVRWEGEFASQTLMHDIG